MNVRGRKLLHQMRVHWRLYLPAAAADGLPDYFQVHSHGGRTDCLSETFRFARASGAAPWVGLDYFKRFFGTYMFGRVLKNTLILSAYSIFAGFPMPILFALCLNVMRCKAFKKTVQMITYAPHFISTTVLVGMLMSLLNEPHGHVRHAVQPALRQLSARPVRHRRGVQAPVRVVGHLAGDGLGRDHLHCGRFPVWTCSCTRRPRSTARGG